MKKLVHAEYGSFLTNLKSRIVSARESAYQSVNRHLVELYLYIGQGIYEKVELAKWGDGIINKLAEDLKYSFPDMKGFSPQNLWRMKQIYEVCRSNEKLSPLVRELSWTHNITILHHTGTPEEKEFYLKTCIKEKWSKRELERQIESGLFERFMLSKKTQGLIVSSRDEDKTAHFKDEYALDFLGLKEQYSEMDLQKAIVANLKKFILELGRHFTFVGEEYVLNVAGEEPCLASLT